MSMLTSKIIPLSFVFMALFCTTPTSGFSIEAEDVRTIELPAPDKTGGMPLMKALAERQSTRSLSDTALSEQEIADTLWAAFGMNRKDGKRTIPTAHNKQNVALYAYTQGHIWIYDAEAHAMHKLIPVDLADVSKGALMLIYTAEGDAKTDAYGNMHAGSMYQNVGLYCASAGLGNVVHRSGGDKVQEALAPYLPSAYTVRILQSVGKMK